MKYIIVNEDGIEVPIIFSELLSHKSVAGEKNVVSAGFCSIGTKTIMGEDSNGSEDKEEIDILCWGKSVSLGVKSRLEDSEIVLKHVHFRC